MGLSHADEGQGKGPGIRGRRERPPPV